MRFGCEVREAQMYECDSHDIHDEAQAFSEWVDQRSLDLEAPAEWLAAWELYVSDDDEDDPDIGGVDEAQEWYDYDPDC